MIMIPESLSMGKLETTVDNVQPYEIRVSDVEPGETVTVSAPAGGNLYSGSKHFLSEMTLAHRQLQRPEWQKRAVQRRGLY